MSRAAHTIGVAIAVPEPYGAELTKWRETLGDPLALAIPPHVTLITPMQVDDDQLALVIDHLDLVASGQWPFDIQLRGTGSFRPVSPVVFVALAAGISDCERIERAVRSRSAFPSGEVQLPPTRDGCPRRPARSS